VSEQRITRRGPEPATPVANADDESQDLWTRVRQAFRGPLAPARMSALYLLIFFFVLFGILSPSTFLTSTSVNLVLSQGVITAVLAFAFLVPMSAGTFDLAIGANMSLALVLMNYLGLHGKVAPGLSVIIALLACGLVGAISGFIIVRLRVNSFIATLGMSQVVSALVLLISGDQQLVGAFSQSFLNLGQSDVLGIPIVVYYLAAIALVLWFVLEYTPFGRYLFATGGNKEAARLAGVGTDRLIWSSLVISGVLAGCGGVIFAMQVGTFSSDVGPGYLFPAIAAVFFGAVQFSQRPNVLGTLLALYSLAFGVKGLELTFNSGIYWIDPLFQGLSLILAVALAAHQGHIRVRRAKEKTVANIALQGDARTRRTNGDEVLGAKAGAASGVKPAG
jgi:ribose transport system permease protein